MYINYVDLQILYRPIFPPIHLVFPIRQAPPNNENPVSTSLTNNTSHHRDEPVTAYYPGTEINGFMPHRGEFATVSVTLNDE